jgi:hypothetical protein
MSQAAYSINLNRETFDLLEDVRKRLVEDLGFEPTLGQVVRHLISIYHAHRG